jgi:hypothetical protein
MTRLTSELRYVYQLVFIQAIYCNGSDSFGA